MASGDSRMAALVCNIVPIPGASPSELLLRLYGPRTVDVELHLTALVLVQHKASCGEIISVNRVSDAGDRGAVAPLGPCSGTASSRL